VRVLDLFCGAGGASMGLHRAGFDVIGVDIAPRPRYPFPFVQADALRPPLDLRDFDFIWASPPCQAHTSMKTMHNAKDHADLIPATREMLMKSGVPWVMENVVGAPLLNAFTLCGTMFGLGVEDAELRRHRLFEASFLILAPECRHGSRVQHGYGGASNIPAEARTPVIGIYGGHARNRRRARTVGIYGEGVRDSRRKFNKGVPDFTIDQGREAMGIDWMTTAELSQAIPPAYGEFIGRAAMAQLKAAA
jgi:DNA (cytosine-5)-methyltransferase 1